ncbi:MAG: peptidylprolyl isomerase [Planctomycetes bacterium]|nr:peptidylprolyl isomerase [Planctomycetota bacterium]MCB9905113.1 peptidylprolyl isomerase [Planctomycetota bacterium]
MAEHKSAAEVVIAPRGDEKSGFALWVEKNGLLALVGLLLISAVVVVKTQMSASSQASEKADWGTLSSAMSISTPGSVSLTEASLEGLAKASVDLKGSAVAGAWASYAYATALGLENRYEEAEAELARLQSSFPDHPLNQERFAWSDGQNRTLPEQMRRVYADQSRWREAHAGAFENPDPPAGAPRVVMETTAGNIEIALYPELAPDHVANFLKHVESDFYVGTKFHRVIPDFMIQGGDPNTRDNEDRATWGQGGTDYTIPHEENPLKHFRGYLSAAKKPGDTEEAGAQFFITTGNPHHLDGQHTVFGKVISGMEVVTTIEQAETEVATPSLPKEPVAITKVSLQ